MRSQREFIIGRLNVFYIAFEVAWELGFAEVVGSIEVACIVL